MSLSKIFPFETALKEGSIDIWLLHRGKSQQHLDMLYSLLSEGEKRHNPNFMKKKHRETYVLTRGILRLLISSYLLKRPECISLCYGNKGKPHIDSEENQTGLEFNLSHSGDYILFAFSRGKSVGVDIQKRKELDNMETLMKYVFPRKMLSRAGELHEGESADSFFRFWTRLEALVKATGLGLLAYKKEILPDFSGPSPCTCRFMGENWSIHDLLYNDAYSAAVCAKGAPADLNSIVMNDHLIKNILRMANKL